ncbi:MAG: hypothetical protein HC904_09120 [Blastochloris sp.]|nr:hypothetical protein [Blastochloris sp.]
MNTISKEEFLREYTKDLLQGDAALFVGAGLSIPAGMVDWRTLLKDIAKDLQLDIDQEHDLLAVAQYEFNRKGTRDSLNRAIVEWFAKEGKLTDNHKLIARLPLDTIWTTNYDQIIEEAFRDSQKVLDVKHSVEQLPIRKPGAMATLFKMHGDVSLPNSAILTKDDYECYEANCGAFTTQLLGDLISKSFLFLGFSFTDPNIEYTFNRLRRLLNPYRKINQSLRSHYCIQRSPQARDFEGKSNADDILRIEKERFRHRIEDLKRLGGVQTIVIDDYREITDLLTALHRRVSTRSVMISGASHDSSPLGQVQLDQLAEAIGKKLIENDYDVVSGVGKGLGASLLVGAHQALGNPYVSRRANRLRLFPFPYWHEDNAKRMESYKYNRAEMASQAGVSIFISGNKLENGETINSPGVRAEYDEAKKNGHFIIPIGASGWAAKQIWDEVMPKLKTLYAGFTVDSEFDVLGNASSVEKILEAVFSILNKIRNGGR